MQNAQPMLAAAGSPPVNRWVSGFVLVVCALTCACVGYLYLDGPVLRQATTPALPADYAASNDRMTGTGMAGFALGESGADQAGGDGPGADAAIPPAPPARMAQAAHLRTRIADSPWEQQREEELWVQRRNAEMMPLTPGVTEDQYVDGSDEAPAAATQTDEEDE